MNSLLTKLMANRGFQDGAGIVRGIWRVVDAATTNNHLEVYPRANHNIIVEDSGDQRGKEILSKATVSNKA